MAAHRGARIASICTGAFVLAAAGVLNGRRAATHWMHARTLSERYPQVAVDAAALYVDAGDVLTSAGKSAGMNLCLHIVREDHGAMVANQVARRPVAPPHREGHQRQYANPVSHTVSNDIVGDTMEWVLAHLDEPLTLEQLAQRSGVSVRAYTDNLSRGAEQSPSTGSMPNGCAEHNSSSKPPACPSNASPPSAASAPPSPSDGIFAKRLPPPRRPTGELSPPQPPGDHAIEKQANAGRQGRAAIKSSFSGTEPQVCAGRGPGGEPT
jgi:DJ-1/PfpI family